MQEWNRLEGKLLCALEVQTLLHRVLDDGSPISTVGHVGELMVFSADMGRSPQV